MTNYENTNYETPTYEVVAQPEPAPVHQYPPRGKMVTSMVMGIVSVSMWFYPFITSIPCIIFGIIALVLAGGCKGAPQNFRGMLKAARITGTIGIIISVLYTLLYIVIIAVLVAESSSPYSYYYYY